jgi:methylmalonyl-CoA mutase
MSLDTFDSIFQQFPVTTPEGWKNKIIKDLKGDEFEKLIWHSKEDIEVLPFYTKEDHQKYQLNIPEKQTKHWLITERIIVDSILAANKNALFALQSGATAIQFDLKHQSFTKEEIELLLKDILLDIAPVIFENYTPENKIILESIVKNACPNGIKIPPLNSITDELVFVLENGSQQDFSNIQFQFYCTQNYFFEIAKLRAFRWLWKQVCDLKQQPFSIFIQSETSLQKRNETDEYTNMLRNTTEAMSAVLGGCDSLIINSHDVTKENTDFGKRIARNIHHILQHESYFTEIQDAAKGAYYIEYLTYQLCKKSWEMFSNI